MVSVTVMNTWAFLKYWGHVAWLLPPKVYAYGLKYGDRLVRAISL